MDPETESAVPKAEITIEKLPQDHNTTDKTEELVNTLETQVDKAYSSIQDSTLTSINKLQGLVNEKLPEFQTRFDEYVKKEDLDKLKQRSGELLTNVSENTNKVLDNIDEDLEKIENLTLEYATKFGGQVGGFLKAASASATAKAAAAAKEVDISKVAESAGSWNWSAWGKQLTGLISGSDADNEIAKTLKEEKKTELYFNLPKGITEGTRAESEIHELESDTAVYFNALQNKEYDDYKLTEEDEQELKAYLQNDSLHLMKLFNEIASSEQSEQSDDKLDSQMFWKIYFGIKNKILDAEKKRRSLLSKEGNEQEEEEEFNWDD